MQATLLEEKRDAGLERIEAPRPTRRRTVMGQAKSALFWGLLSFVALQVAMRVFLDHARPDLRNPTFEIKAAQLAKHMQGTETAPTTVITLGSSMMINGISPKLLEAPLAEELGRPTVVYNMGVFGGGPFSHLVYTRRLLERGVRPDLVVVEVFPLHFDETDKPLDYRRYPAFVLEKNDVPVVARYGDAQTLHKEWWEAYLVPVYGHRLTIMNGLAEVFVPFKDRVERWKTIDEYGWSRLPYPTEEQRRTAMAHVKKYYGPKLGKFNPGGPGPKAMDELLGMLKKDNVPTVMLLMPEGPVMQGLYDPKGWAKFMEGCKALSRKHSVPIFSARDWFGEEDFVESFHLHEKGAKAFTERLGRELIAPMLKRQQRQIAQRE